MSNNYELSTVLSWIEIRRLRKKGMIDEETFIQYKHRLFDVLHSAGKYHLWNDEKYQVETLGYEKPNKSYIELRDKIDEEKPEGIFLFMDFIYNLGKDCVISRDNDYYSLFLFIRLADISTVFYNDFLNYHFNSADDKNFFIELIKGLTRDYDGTILKKGQTETINEWLGKKKRKNETGLKGPNSLIDIMNKPGQFEEKVCEKLAKNRCNNERHFVKTKVNEQVKDKTEKEYYWESDFQLLAVLHQHLLEHHYIHFNYKTLKDVVLRDLYCDFFHHKKMGESIFELNKRKNLYKKFQKIFFFIS